MDGVDLEPPHPADRRAHAVLRGHLHPRAVEPLRREKEGGGRGEGEVLHADNLTYSHDEEVAAEPSSIGLSIGMARLCHPEPPKPPQDSLHSQPAGFRRRRTVAGSQITKISFERLCSRSLALDEHDLRSLRSFDVLRRRARTAQTSRFQRAAPAVSG